LEERLPSRTAHNLHAIARLKDGISPGQALAELSGIARRLKQQYGRDIDMADAAIEPLREAETGQTRPALLMLLGAAAFLLLIACVNVVNLLLTQATARGRELAIRAALGAERRRLLQQFLTEALLLSLVGGAFGVLAAFWGIRGLLALAPSNLPRLEEVSLNTPVLLFALAVSVAVAADVGLITGVRATDTDPQGVLAETGRDQAGTVRSRRLGAVLVSAQLAVTLVLLIGAGLLARSLLRVLSVDPGFRMDNILTIDLALPPAERDAEKVRRVQFLNELFARLRAIPGVQEVGSTSGLPLASDAFIADGTYILLSSSEPTPRMEDLERLFHDTARIGHADYFVVSEGYFRTLGIPLVRGRLFDDRDTADAPQAALISESLAREKWPNQDPLGHTIEFGNMDGDLRPLTVVGVVGDVHTSLEAVPLPAIYVNYRQRPQALWKPAIVLRSEADPATIIPPVREIVHKLDPDVPPSFSTFNQVFSISLQARRFNLILAGVFAATALLLATAGIYGVTSYSVARRTREIGVRMALGASRRTVLVLVLGQSMRTAAIGVAAGIAGALALTRAMATLLFGVSATDPATFAGVALLLAAISAVACFIPARRATRVEPIVALRYE
jgi:predicted permease